MKYLMLLAGKGTRLGNVGRYIPKCLLVYKNSNIISYHINIAKRFDKIIGVIGHKGNLIETMYPNITYYFNKDYEKTNMVKSFMCAKSEFDDDMIIAYGDIIYNKSILQELVDIDDDFVVTVDINWKKYWKMRFDDINNDLESLSLENGYITELGNKNVKIDNIDARYVGLLKFTKKGLDIIKSIIGDDEKWNNAHMTDLLQHIIDSGYKVKAYEIDNQWIEFDTYKDRLNANKVGDAMNVV